MNCPHCLSIMYCASEIHNLPNNTQRMDLHCWRDDCPTRKIIYRPHMGVLTRPNEVWVCWDYHIPFQHQDKWYCLEGKQMHYDVKIQNHIVGEGTLGSTKIHKLNKDPIDKDVYLTSQGYSYAQSIGVSFAPKPPLIDLDFIPISTGDDMHEEAQRLFNRLMKLVPFS